MTQGLSLHPSLGILLVEDETIAAIELECMIEDLGHRVVAAAVTPVQARRHMRDFGHRIDLVIFGAHLVGLSSLDYARSLARADIAAVVTSRLEETEVRLQGFEEPYLAKPFDADDVSRLLRVVASEIAHAA